MVAGSPPFMQWALVAMGRAFSHTLMHTGYKIHKKPSTVKSPYANLLLILSGGKQKREAK